MHASVVSAIVALRTSGGLHLLTACCNNTFPYADDGTAKEDFQHCKFSVAASSNSIRHIQVQEAFGAKIAPGYPKTAQCCDACS